jgi:hypothetical protein
MLFSSMSLRISRAFAVIFVVGSVLVAGAPAQAATVAPLTFIGAGTVSPGLPTTGAANNVTYQFNGTVSGTATVGAYTIVVANAPCTGFVYSTIAETLMTGAGVGTLDCEAPTGMVGADASARWRFHLRCSLVLTRVDWTWRLVLRCYVVVDYNSAVMAEADVNAEATLKGEPTSVNPVTSYTLAGPLVVGP